MIAKVLLAGLLIAPWAWNQEAPSALPPEFHTADLPSILIERSERLFERFVRLRNAEQALESRLQESTVCSVRLPEMQPNDDAVIRIIEIPNTTAKMPQVRVPAPPCPKAGEVAQSSSGPAPEPATVP